MREMKDSSIDVIGVIPKKWEKNRLKYLCSIETGNEDTQNATPDGIYPFYVRSPIVELCDRYTFDGEGILVAGDGAGAGRIFHHAFGKYAVHQRVYRLANFNFNSFFINFWLSLLFPYEMDKGSAQSTVPSMRLPMLLNFPVFLPPCSEANKIVTFLNQICSEIDALTADIQTQIETLEEYKKSVITEAVTKGLDPNVEMKDSGVEWIGKIPEKWAVPKILYCLKMPITDGPHTTPALYDEGIPFVSAEAVSFGRGSIDFTHIRGYISNEFYRECCKKYIPSIGDIFMIKSGATTGKVSIVDTDKIFTIWSPLAVFRTNSSILKEKYLFYVLQSDYIQKQIQTRWSYGTQENIGMRVLEKLKITLPQINTQTEIADFLDKKCSEIDQTISEKQQQLEILAEYKKSLIYEYVTGKKEVS